MMMSVTGALSAFTTTLILFLTLDDTPFTSYSTYIYTSSPLLPITCTDY